MVDENGNTIPLFLSTPSARRATAVLPVYGFPYLYFYPRPPRGGRLFQDSSIFTVLCISIHALREEGDRLQAVCVLCLSNFYPRPPRGGRRGNLTTEFKNSIFLSTPSARRATLPKR